MCILGDNERFGHYLYILQQDNVVELEFLITELSNECVWLRNDDV